MRRPAKAPRSIYPRFRSWSPQNFPCPRDHIARQARKARDFDAIAFVRASGLDASQKNDFVARLLRRTHVRSSRRAAIASSSVELVVVRRKERARPSPACSDSTTAQAIERPSNVEVPRPTSSSSTRLARRGRVQDCGDFAHLDQKSGSPARQVVRRANARENSVEQRQLGLHRRHKRSHLRENRNQRRLPQVGGFPAHVGPVMISRNCESSSR